MEKTSSWGQSQHQQQPYFSILFVQNSHGQGLPMWVLLFSFLHQGLSFLKVHSAALTYFLLRRVSLLSLSLCFLWKTNSFLLRKRSQPSLVQKRYSNFMMQVGFFNRIRKLTQFLIRRVGLNFINMSLCYLFSIAQLQNFDSILVGLNCGEYSNNLCKVSS